MIGRHTVDALLRRGVRVRALARPRSRSPNLDGLPVERVLGDASDASALRPALEGCDLLFHCAAPYPRSHFRRALQVAEAERSMRAVLQAARERVPRELLELPAGRLAARAV
jgi:dihydroflavonol-4-reductase